eukprot:GDKJ01003392.1.p1 GENE.GDKJ01003392.1~~GDKJ01003392.1.p1  ORF type:complete len:519 (-),score=65.67 GDKJ01003392.1:70-1626(-)
MSEFEEFFFDSDSEEVDRFVESIPKSPETYELLTWLEVRQRLNNYVDEFLEVIPVPKEYASFILHEYDFDVEFIKDLWFSLGEEKFYEKFDPNILSFSNPTGTVTCLICLEEKSSSSAWMLNCSHSFCEECWVKYVDHAICNMRQSKYSTIQCPAHQCYQPIPLQFMKSIMHSNKNPMLLLSSYEYFLTKRLLKKMSEFATCPNTECKIVSHRLNRAWCDSVTCLCGTIYCFSCEDEMHNPIDCSTLRRWRKEKEKFNYANLKWIVNNTKLCPSCKHAIEKNQGCNHIKCHCGYDFCWMCLEQWIPHPFTAVSPLTIPEALFDECTSPNKMKNKFSKTLEIVQNYQASFLYIQNGITKVKLRISNLKHAEKGVEERKSENCRWKNIEFGLVLKALQLVLKCKNVLCWTEVLCFFLVCDKNKKLNLLQFSMNDLNKNVECLHVQTEREFSLLCQLCDHFDQNADEYFESNTYFPRFHEIMSKHMEFVEALSQSVAVVERMEDNLSSAISNGFFATLDEK